MKLNTLSKVLFPLTLLLTMSVNAAIIDYTIDVTDHIYDPEGMAWDGTYLWVVDDDTDDEAHQIDAVTGQLVSSFAIDPAGFGTPDVESIAWDGSNLWIADSAGVIGEYATDGTLLSTITAALTGVTAEDFELEGMTWDGSYLWVAEESSGNIFQLDSLGNTINYFSTGLIQTSSVSFYNDSFWIGDDETDRIYQYDASTFGLLSDLDLEALLIDANIDITFNDPKGITWDDKGNLWFSDDGDEVLVRINYDAVRVPEPSTIALFSLMLVFVNQKRRKNTFFTNNVSINR